MDTFGDRALAFYRELKIDQPLPGAVVAMNPYRSAGAAVIPESFFGRFYSDNRPRTGIFGINPGRMGAGITGITFTDPIRLEEECGIENPFQKRPELSSTFIYAVINSYGGVRPFFSRFFMTAVSPLGFKTDGKNLNYYDRPELEDALRGFILTTLRDQIGLGLRTDRIICLGEGKNFKYLTRLNTQERLFGKIIPLPHPRWIMQYRYRQRGEFVRKYLEALRSLPEP